jgi:hypothetical protein
MEPNEPSVTPSDDPAKDKKERVLHTRVPAVLEQELKRFADNLRVPVSNLVRTILEDALQVADVASNNVEERLRKAAESIEHERVKLKQRVQREDPLAKVFAFQEVTLAQSAQCAKCNTRLDAGSRAFLGLTDPPTHGRAAPRILACAACLPKPEEEKTS